MCNLLTVEIVAIFFFFVLNECAIGKTASCKTMEYSLYPVYMMKYGHCHEKTCHLGFANNTGADHPRSLISAFVIRFIERINCKLAVGEISIF